MMGRRSLRVAISTAAVVALLFSCNKKVEPDCQPVGKTLFDQIQRATSSSITTAYASPSRTVPDVWLVGAKTDKGVAVWTSSIGPNEDGISFVLNANQAAADDSVVGVDVPEGTGAPAAEALKDSVGIAVATACVSSATGTT